ncbi:hypothetical protein AYL99_10997 [Fonsecaea erecta]|uniref:Uncharacterized protein n=1 Tax=Fonsecaea erecta TaxID=1367422 RepID=A0A178Z486_9EURO|nr:hypothetical protein AYL99_10997 [Fonsecaea erecta]OAP54549.1 hypothetical protein AYL99_10997 [Fonsecaea erecta]
MDSSTKKLDTSKSNWAAATEQSAAQDSRRETWKNHEASGGQTESKDGKTATAKDNGRKPPKDDEEPESPRIFT